MPLIFFFVAAAAFSFFCGVALLKRRNPILEMVALQKKGKEAARRSFLRELWRCDDDLLSVGVVSALTTAAVVYGLTRFVPAAVLFAALAFVFVPRFYGRVLQEKRKAAFLQHLARCVAGMCSVLRASPDVLNALEYGAKSVPEPMRSEVLFVLDKAKSNTPISEAAQQMAERVGLEEVRVLAEGLSLVTDVGGPAGIKLLESTVEFLKERAMLRRKVSAATADIRLGFTIGSVFPFGLAGLMALAMPEYRAAFSSPSGRLPILLAVALVVVGHVIVRKLLKGAEEVL
ncbi:Flp pilus assembly protein TadB [Thermodesulfitimonas autotrophica]|uniref:Flp pilus assembly protein TadB n=1 Tax=Thermodesulfitimonas autotrophica TaxID=1894989 RepID=A0A3N5BPN7_9THEO|nr:type II secretion system F family protein [Thermodesulfitimonas autotrophica]RPF49582.1 Flp pilus assembly protein TadB [Thermodesulfitimonas autotrophica]